MGLQWAWQRCAAVMLCVCSFIFVPTGCGNMSSINGSEDDPTVPEYYWYGSEGQKIYLNLNTGFAFLSVKEPQLPVDIAQRGIKASSEFKTDYADTKQYKGVYGQRRYIAQLELEKGLTDKQYLELLSDIKKKNKDVIIAPYFKIEGGSINDQKIQLSNFFHVKIKDNVDILEQMAMQTKCMIVFQDTSMPEWFTLSVTEESELNALECANLFHESGLFQKGEPDISANLIEPWL